MRVVTDARIRRERVSRVESHECVVLGHQSQKWQRMGSCSRELNLTPRYHGNMQSPSDIPTQGICSIPKNSVSCGLGIVSEQVRVSSVLTKPCGSSLGDIRLRRDLTGLGWSVAEVQLYGSLPTLIEAEEHQPWVSQHRRSTTRRRTWLQPKPLPVRGRMNVLPTARAYTFLLTNVF
jgi:hypothetical protein